MQLVRNQQKTCCFFVLLKKKKCVRDGFQTATVSPSLPCPAATTEGIRKMVRIIDQNQDRELGELMSLRKGQA